MNATGRTAWWAGALVFIAGCGDAGPTLVPVTGKVQVNGKILRTGTIAYLPEAGDKSAKEAKSAIRDDGAYSLWTGEKAGAAPGAYRVVVSAMEMTDSTQPPKRLVAQIYAAGDSTPLRKTVAANAPAGTYDLDLNP